MVNLSLTDRFHHQLIAHSRPIVKVDVFDPGLLETPSGVGSV